MERDRAELERKVVDICKEARRRNAEAAQSDLISGHGGPPRMAPRNNEIRGRWPSRSRIDDDDVRQGLMRCQRFSGVALFLSFGGGKSVQFRGPGDGCGDGGARRGNGGFRAR